MSELLSFLSTFTFEEKLYIAVIIAFVPITLLGIFASVSVSRTFRKYSSEPTACGVRAAEAARDMLDGNGLTNVAIHRVEGELTDHFDPRTQTISLSNSVYPSSSIGAVGVACHEAGHAVQHARGFVFSRVRLALVPVVNIANRTLMPLMIIGMLLGFLSIATSVGLIFVVCGLVLFGMSTLFALVTLPTEFDASRRALNAIASSGNYTKRELSGAKKVLRAAALTYVAAFLMSLLQFLRFLLIILMSFSRRRN
ncbi:MAG: zinc metallopeptidase [Clostridiales bacterium]|jgi:Zn-dependent membrane protease YugP|nr:zinc metallopeptidase [Clostridiales bacterium]